MIYRLTLSDWRTIAHYLGFLILLVALAQVIPLCAGLVMDEQVAACHFLLSIGICLTAGGLLSLCRVESGSLDWHQSLVITGLCWVVLSLFSAVPLYLSGNYLTYFDAFFDTVSAYTTTGLSLCVDVDHMAACVALWRAIMHLIGGIGVVVIALALGVFGTGMAAAALYHAEARSGQVMPEIKQTSRFIIVLSAAIVIVGTVVSFVTLLFAGLSPGSAFYHAFLVTVSSFSTGGMSNHSLGIMYFHSWPLEIVTIVLAVFGCINFVLYGDLWKGKTRGFFKDIEIRTLAIWVLALVLLMAFALVGNEYFSTFTAELRRGMYTLLSGAFNLGMSTIYPGQMMFAMGSGALFVVIMSMLICGSMSSASGGIKAWRVGIVARSIVQTIREALAPDRARPRTFYYHQGKRLLRSDAVSSAMIIMLLYIITCCVGAVVGIAHGYDALSAIFDSVSATSNTGLSMGVVGVDMPLSLEVCYILQMWLGRLEFIAAFAMFVEFFAFLSPRKRTYLRKKKS